jgi:hypothetical protein
MQRFVVQQNQQPPSNPQIQQLHQQIQHQRMQQGMPQQMGQPPFPGQNNGSGQPFPPAMKFVSQNQPQGQNYQSQGNNYHQGQGQNYPQVQNYHPQGQSYSQGQNYQPQMDFQPRR